MGRTNTGQWKEASGRKTGLTGALARAGGKKVSAAGEVGRPQEWGKVLMSSERVKHTESWNCGRVPGLCRMGGVGN